jgi:hypothetical protein
MVGVERFFVTLTAVGFAALVVCLIWIFLVWLAGRQPALRVASK